LKTPLSKVNETKPTPLTSFLCQCHWIILINTCLAWHKAWWSGSS